MKLSVIIPVYNAEKFIEKCIESVLAQSYENWEIIAVDDGSTDNSYEILKKYSLRDQRIKVYNQENAGPGITRNTGMKLASGDYLAFLDSDDSIEPNLYEKVSQKIQAEESDIVFFDAIRKSPDGRILGIERLSSYCNYDKEYILKCQITGKFPWGGWRKVIRRSLIETNNIYYSAHEIGEEAVFSFLALYFANKISFVEGAFYNYTIRPFSQSGKHNEDPWGPICRTLKEVICEMGLNEIFEASINSFAFTAMMVSINRAFNYYGLFRTYKFTRIALKKFKNEYGFNLETFCLETRVKLLLPTTKLGIITPIIGGAVINRLIRKLKGLP